MPANCTVDRNCDGTELWNHSVLFRKIAPRIAPGTDPSPPTTAIVSARMLWVGPKMSVPPTAC